jgi:hypothetical protein
MLDADLAPLYDVPTGQLVRAVTGGLRGTRATFVPTRPKRRHHLNVRLSEDEAAALEGCAARWRRSRSDFLRRWIREDEAKAHEVPGESSR